MKAVIFDNDGVLTNSPEMFSTKLIRNFWKNFVLNLKQNTDRSITLSDILEKFISFYPDFV